jgi:hypothetical protein
LQTCEEFILVFSYEIALEEEDDCQIALSQPTLRTSSLRVLNRDPREGKNDYTELLHLVISIRRWRHTTGTRFLTKYLFHKDSFISNPSLSVHKEGRSPFNAKTLDIHARVVERNWESGSDKYATD